MSSSLPVDVQIAAYRTIPGMEQVEIMRPAYAIEYDCIDSTQLKLSLESRNIEGLFLAGQINGSSGYEEAAAQGIIAGINAVQYIRQEEPLILDRSDAYIGVLIDDLVTKGTPEPYRMMTSRAEYRLSAEAGQCRHAFDRKGIESAWLRKSDIKSCAPSRKQFKGNWKIKECCDLTFWNGLMNTWRIRLLPLKSGIQLYDLLKRPEISFFRYY